MRGNQNEYCIGGCKLLFNVSALSTLSQQLFKNLFRVPKIGENIDRWFLPSWLCVFLKICWFFHFRKIWHGFTSPIVALSKMQFVWSFRACGILFIVIWALDCLRFFEIWPFLKVPVVLHILPSCAFLKLSSSPSCSALHSSLKFQSWWGPSFLCVFLIWHSASRKLLFDIGLCFSSFSTSVPVCFQSKIYRKYSNDFWSSIYFIPDTTCDHVLAAFCTLSWYLAV